MNRDEINSLPLESDVSFRQHAVEPDNTECLTLDGYDRGFLTTLVDAACATYSQLRHAESIVGFKGYCRTLTTDELIAELESNHHERQFA